MSEDDLDHSEYYSEEPLMFQLREFIEERPGEAYMSKSTGTAGREDDYDD